jgi:hypothetical protein
MKEITEIKNRKTPIVRVDTTLDKYDDKILFPDKLEKANEALKRVGLPKQWINGVHLA